MSMLLPLLLQTADPAVLIATAVERTRADAPCRSGADGDEVVICARRDADLYRVPLNVAPAPGDPRAIDAFGERARLLRVPQLPCGVGAFLSQCGSVGVTVSSANGFRPTGGPRPLAP